MNNLTIMFIVGSISTLFILICRESHHSRCIKINICGLSCERENLTEAEIILETQREISETV
jgi:hypothetical protein